MESARIHSSLRRAGHPGWAQGACGFIARPPRRRVLARIPGFTVRGGRLPGTDLPALSEPEALPALRRHLEASPSYYARFEGGRLPLREVSRLSRLGELWVECGPVAPDDAVDLAAAGAARLVVPLEQAEAMADVLGWNLALRWDPARVPAEEALPRAAAFDAPLVSATRIEAPAAPAGVAHLFHLTEGPEPWRLTLERTVEGPPDEGTPEARPDAPPPEDAPRTAWTDL
jgi:hypothetical protein